MHKKLFIYGHRGAKGARLENTIESIEYAIKCNVNGIEIDCQPCLDEDIIFHDRFVVKNGEPVPVNKIARSELQTLAANTDLFPTLSQILSYSLKTVLNIEWKCEKIADSARQTIDRFIRDNPTAVNSLLFSSFSMPLLQESKRYFPSIKRAPIFYGVPLGLQGIIDELNPTALHLSKDFLTEEMIACGKANSISIAVYTINSVPEAEMLAKRGIDAIFTDFPERFTTSPV